MTTGGMRGLLAALLGLTLLQDAAAFSHGSLLGLPMGLRDPRAAGVSSSRPPFGGAERARGLRLHMQAKPGGEPAPAQQLGISNQGIFLIASSLTYAAIIGTSADGPAGIITPSIAHQFLVNLPAAIFCFGGADIATQHIERSVGLAASDSLDVRRALSAVAVGIVCNAFGLAVWLHYLGEVVPLSSIGVDSADGIAHLAAKSMLHSWVWGTLGNTIALVGRRVLAGDTWEEAVQLWSDKIFPVTEKQLLFWPAWQAMNFALVPDVWQAQVTGAGSFFFNVFMSWVASSAQREAIERARMTEVDGLNDSIVGVKATGALQEAEAVDDSVVEGRDKVLGGAAK